MLTRAAGRPCRIPAPPAHRHCGASVVTAQDAVATTEDPYMTRKSNQTPARRNRAAVEVPQPPASGKKTNKGRDSARASARNGTKQETTKRSHPDGASAPKTTKTTKVQTILNLLDQPNGTTVAAIMKATGWQRHSVRGFFAGTVRKKLGLALVSETVDDQRVYRLLAGKPGKSRSATATAASTPSAG